MKIGIDIGHNVKYNTGARGILSEDKCTMEVGTLLIGKLRRAGHIVIETLPKSATSQTNSLAQRTTKANSEGVEYFVSIHFNAFNGNAYGSEVLYKTDKGKELGEPILKEIINAIGTKSRGMIYRGNLYVLNKTKMPAIIVEGLFVDNKEDVEKYNAEKISEAIFKGITGKSSVEEKKESNKDEVKNLQMALNLMSMTDNNDNKLIVDGILGSRTQAASAKLVSYIKEDILK